MVMVATAAAGDTLPSLRAGHGPECLTCMSSSCHAAALCGTPILPGGGSGIGGGLDRWALTTAEAETGRGTPASVSDEGPSELRSKGHRDGDTGWGHEVGFWVASQTREPEPWQGLRQGMQRPLHPGNSPSVPKQ